MLTFVSGPGDIGVGNPSVKGLERMRDIGRWLLRSQEKNSEVVWVWEATEPQLTLVLRTENLVSCGAFP